MAKEPKKIFRCPGCGSTNAGVSGAELEWNVDSQDWDITFNSYTGPRCYDCGTEDVKIADWLVVETMRDQMALFAGDAA